VSEVRLDRDGGVALITLDAPARRNALNPAMAAELLAACDEVDRDPSVGAVVVRAEGASFCSGADRALLRAAAEDPASSASVAALDAVYSAFTRVGALAAPVIAAVGGHAVGAGVNLVLAADLRVLADTAQIITGFADIGVHPGGGHFALLGRVVGRDAVAALTLFGARLDADRAVEVGLAWEAGPAPACPGRPRSSWSAAYRCGRWGPADSFVQSIDEHSNKYKNPTTRDDMKDGTAHGPRSLAMTHKTPSWMTRRPR
jgi:enoyl-CoA hydratase